MGWRKTWIVAWCCTAERACACREGKYFYYSKTLEGEQYRVNCRRRMPLGMGRPTGPFDHSFSASQTGTEVEQAQSVCLSVDALA